METTININKKFFLERILSCQPADFKLFIVANNTPGEPHIFDSLWKLSDYLKNLHPSNQISGIIIASSSIIELPAKKEMLDQHLIDFIIIINQTHDCIPDQATLIKRVKNTFSVENYPFFLMPQELTIIKKISDKSALCLFSKSKNIFFYQESIKLLEDAGYECANSEIIQKLEYNERSIDHFVKRIEEKIEQISQIVFFFDIEKNIIAKIEKKSGKTVLTREDLIISIFEKRADCSSGKLKVAAAVIKKEKSLLRTKISGLSRIRGGIGLKGPGETKEEERKRIFRIKEKKIKSDVKKEVLRIDSQRKFREKSEFPTLAIVGYTNAGKSTLFNTLLGEKAVTESSQFFSSIDPKIKRFQLFGKSIFLIDTVGLIDGMTKGTTEAFYPTFKEIENASLIFHVIDPTDINWRDKKIFVEKLMIEKGVEEERVVVLFSKKELLQTYFADNSALFYSAFDKDDISKIKKMIFERLFCPEPILLQSDD